MKLLMLLVTVSQLAFAWGKAGHEVIAEIASKHLTGRANSELKSILAAEETLASVSNWADEAKDLKEWAGSDKWHYLDFPDQATFQSLVPQKLGPNIIQAIVRFEDVLRNKASTAEEKKAAVKFLVHLVADVHQPLHISTVKQAGGSKTHVKFFGAERTPQGPKFNLHRIWDIDLIQKFVTEKKFEGGNNSAKAYAASLDKGEIKEVVQWQNSYVWDWVKESASFRDAAFGYKGSNIDEDYYLHAMVIVNTRLLQAGYRLSKLFNDIYSGEELSPAAKELRVTFLK